MNPHLEDINYPDGGSTAKVIFKSMIYEEDCFHTILGKNEKYITSIGNSYRLGGQSSPFQMHDSRHYLYIEDGKPKGFFAIKENRIDYVRKEILNIHLLYVDKKYQCQGVGKRMVDKLKSFAEKIDGICKSRGKYFSRTIDQRYFSISVYPNMFDWAEGKELDLEKIYQGESMYDFTLDAEDYPTGQDKDGYIPAEWNMLDETLEDNVFTRRITPRKLREFYEDLGFVQCDELQFNSPIEDGIAKRKVAVSNRTLCNMNKTPMIYPDNVELVDLVADHMKSLWNTPVTEELVDDFTENVLSALDEKIMASGLVA
tara:strand:+ start:494 stop:1435 length:942 start_codon:yes stop_codon:yes gene_type:complete